jgi:hypothetical protein
VCRRWSRNGLVMDPGYLNLGKGRMGNSFNSAHAKIRVALKYCGGCDPAYDRVSYQERIAAAAAGHIEWVSIENPPFEAVLVINGCHRACKEKDLASEHQWRIISVRDDLADPILIVKKLFNREVSDD